MYLVLIKLCLAPALDLSAAVSLIATCALYAHKRHTTSKIKIATSDTSALNSAIADATSAKLAELESSVTGLALRVGMKQ